MRSLFVCIFLSFCSLAAAEPRYEAQSFRLLDNLAKTREHDFVVTSINKTYTLLHVTARTEDSVVLEELTVPTSAFAREFRDSGIDWPKWLKNGARGNTSWVMYEINLESAEMTEFFSFTRQGWLDIHSSDSFLPKLLTLRLTRVSDADRRRMGNGALGVRPLWQPRMVVNGQLIRGVDFDAFEATWPKDDSKLSGRKITIYVPENADEYSAYFPYWVDVDSNIPGSRIRVVDSGRGLESPRKRMPRMRPEILDRKGDGEGGLIITVHARRSYQDLRLYAVDEEAALNEATHIPLSYNLKHTAHPEQIELHIPEFLLRDNLQAGKAYRFQVVPVDREELANESSELWHWKGAHGHAGSRKASFD